MTVIFWMFLAIIIVLSVYIVSLHHAISELTKAIQEKLKTGSHVRLMNQRSIPVMNSLIHEFNETLECLEDSKIDYKQERQMLDQTIHNISHDIRTPLTVSWGYTKQLLKQNPTDETLTKIDASLANVSKRLEYLLEYQNLLEKNIKPEKKTVNLTQLLGENVLSFYEIFQQLNLVVEVAIQEGVIIQNDPDILERIIQNILGNVAKHGRDSVRILLNKERNQTVLTVSNRPKQAILNVSKLTQRFYAEDLSSSEKSSGLGLFITEQLVQLTGGQLELRYQEPNFTIQASWPTNT